MHSVSTQACASSRSKCLSCISRWSLGYFEKSKDEVLSALKESKSNIKTDFGWVEEHKKAQYYKNSNLVVLPHIWAPYQSGILHNSIAWGLPIVVTKVGALWEMVALFKFGEIVKSKSTKAIAEGIKKVFEHRNSNFVLPLKFSKNGLMELQNHWKRHLKGLKYNHDFPSEIKDIIFIINEWLEKKAVIIK